MKREYRSLKRDFGSKLDVNDFDIVVEAVVAIAADEGLAGVVKVEVTFAISYSMNSSALIGSSA